MKNLFPILTFVILTVLFSSCASTDSLEEWREANLNAYDAITKNPEYQALKTTTGPSGVYYKVIKSGTGTEYPLQTSKVKVLYKGTYYDGTVFDAGSGESDIPKEFSLTGSEIVRGFSFAVQQMVVGDKWEVWIPYYLGYGYDGYYYYDYYSYQQIIKGYTTLIFAIELVSITQYP